DYAERHPDLADAIRDIFPALIELEDVSPSPDAPPPDDTPAYVGEYRILRKVGEGGMGVVYEAVQESLGRHVALKVLPPGRAGKGGYVARFRNEARAAAKLHHTNIVPVFDVSETDGTLHYAMQFIDGQGLDTVLAEIRRMRGGNAPGKPAAPSTHTLARSVV